MSLTYAGVPLGIITEELASWWETYLPTSGIQEIWEAGWGNGGIPDTLMPPPRAPQNKMPKLNTLYWPNGLSRWAKFYGICNELQLAEIKTATENNVAATLIMDDRDDYTLPLETDMFLLMAYPISKIGNLPETEHQLYLISLVDERYYYWQKTGKVTVWDDWVDWFTQMYALLGITVVDPIDMPAAYKTPSYKFTIDNKPVPLTLDAAARLTGYRIQRAQDGSIRQKQFVTALADAEILYEYYKEYKVAGEMLDDSDLIRIVPATFTALFKSAIGPNKVFTTTLTAMAPQPFLSPHYGSYAGTAGNTEIYYSDYIHVRDSAGGSAEYAAICQALCEQAATDFYGWQLMPPSITFAGICPWNGHASTDYVEYEYAATCITRVVREPFWVSPGTTDANIKETQFIYIPIDSVSNASGDLSGFIREYDYINDEYIDSDYEVWVRDANNDPNNLQKDKVYFCKFTYSPLEELDLYTTVCCGDDILWVIITAKPSADPGPYSGDVGCINDSGTWENVSPGVTLTNLYRTPSNQLPPLIPTGQVVLAAKSPCTDPEEEEKYMITPWGGYFRYLRKIYLGSYCDGGNIVNVYTNEYHGAREYCISPAPVS